jgi:hypothetical protein
MRANYLGILKAVTAALIYCALANGAPAAPTAPTGPDSCNVTRPDTPITRALLTSGLPCKAQFIAPFNLDTLQHGFDFYSWLTFLALNSPDDSKTIIGKGLSIGALSQQLPFRLIDCVM